MVTTRTNGNNGSTGKTMFSRGNSKLILHSSSTRNTNNTILVGIFSFVFGCLLTGTLVANVKVSRLDEHALLERRGDFTMIAGEDRSLASLKQHHANSNSTTQDSNNLLSNVRILVVIVAFDFSQQPHLEEVLESYRDLACNGGTQQLDVIIHATVAWPVTLIDLLSDRLLRATHPWCDANRFTITVTLKPKSLRLFLVDEHRAVFYDKLDDYDLFIYSEDDIRVTPTTVAMYWYETQRLEQLLLKEHNPKWKSTQFNVGIIRYEYNYPANVIMDDNTRHATQNVTRVYWEHSSLPRPVVGNIVHSLQEDRQIPASVRDRYLTMQNHHQGMFLATRSLLQAWRDNPKCAFDKARPRPGKNGQPSEGTQRVWMSSQMLYGGRHCGVVQLLPKIGFGALTVWHLPNKNYRRVGKYRNRKFANASEPSGFLQPHASLLTAMELHLALAQAWPTATTGPYRGIRMIDEVNKPRDRTPLLERRMQEYQEYVQRGGVLSVEDRSKTAQVLMEES